MAEARASADGEVLALGYGDDGVEGQGWYLAGADEGLELEPPVRVGRSMGAERAGQPGATVEDLAAAAAPSALDVQAFNRVLVCPACAKKCAVSMEQCNGCGASLAGVPSRGSRKLQHPNVSPVQHWPTMQSTSRTGANAHAAFKKFCKA